MSLINKSSSTASLLTFAQYWIAANGEEPVQPRSFLDIIIEQNPTLLLTLDAFIPNFSNHPHPKAFIAWLDRIENFPIGINPTYRIQRHKHKWAIKSFHTATDAPTPDTLTPALPAPVAA